MFHQMRSKNSSICNKSTSNSKGSQILTIQQNLKVMKNQADEFMKKGHKQLPPITKARHYLYLNYLKDNVENSPQPNDKEIESSLTGTQKKRVRNFHSQFTMPEQRKSMSFSVQKAESSELPRQQKQRKLRNSRISEKIQSCLSKQTYLHNQAERGLHQISLKNSNFALRNQNDSSPSKIQKRNLSDLKGSSDQLIKGLEIEDEILHKFRQTISDRKQQQKSSVSQIVHHEEKNLESSQTVPLHSQRKNESKVPVVVGVRNSRHSLARCHRQYVATINTSAPKQYKNMLLSSDSENNTIQKASKELQMMNSMQQNDTLQQGILEMDNQTNQMFCSFRSTILPSQSNFKARSIDRGLIELNHRLSQEMSKKKPRYQNSEEERLISELVQEYSKIYSSKNLLKDQRNQLLRRKNELPLGNSQISTLRKNNQRHFHQQCSQIEKNSGRSIKEQQKWEPWEGYDLSMKTSGMDIEWMNNSEII